MRRIHVTYAKRDAGMQGGSHREIEFCAGYICFCQNGARLSSGAVHACLDDASVYMHRVRMLNCRSAIRFLKIEFVELGDVELKDDDMSFLEPKLSMNT